MIDKYKVEILVWGGDEKAAGSVRRMAEECLVPAGLIISKVTSVPERKEEWEKALVRFAGNDVSQCLLTVGGAGYPSSELVPEVAASLIHRPVPGIPEALRDMGIEFGRMSSLFRGNAGLTEKGKLIINLPGEESWLKNALLFLQKILVHALDKASGDTRECGLDS